MVRSATERASPRAGGATLPCNPIRLAKASAGARAHGVSASRQPMRAVGPLHHPI